MRQMKPMNWFNLMIYFLLSMLFTLTNLNFFIMKKKKNYYMLIYYSQFKGKESW
uniref:ATP synthase F0 subunit 8 n=1 Tax=Synergus nanlingensis TaxID=3135082 RepID=UPI0030FE592C